MGSAVASPRGGLRVWLGAAPGVGKTYAMLQEAHRRRSRGTDIVVGFVETHNRPLTIKAAAGLEIIPCRPVEHRGTTVAEMDVEAVIRRHPAIALVDELAHTNAPGSKHAKRWQDIDEIRDAGILVITTVNIQHLESLKDRVEQITGVHVHETVPDRVLAAADDVELADMAPEALRRRMVHGNIYPPERAQRALENFFRPGNLMALREMALNWTAAKADDQVDEALRQTGDGLTADERILVCIDERPLSAALVRRAAYMAHRIGCPMTAVHVRHQGGAREAAALGTHQQLARDLGAEIAEVEGGEPAAAIARYAQENCITQVILGQSVRPRWYEVIHGSVAQRLIRQLPNLDIHVVAERSSRQA